MRSKSVVGVVALVAFGVVGACASNRQYGSAAGGTVDLAAYPVPELPARELVALRGMSDAQILGHIILVDSMEVATADSTIRIAMTDQVLGYARLMRDTHQQDWAATRALAKERGITPVQQVGGLGASHIATQLDSMTQASDLTLDRH